jgi:hypothetical protein
MGRRRGGRCLRFIRNRSDATATNVYHLLYPTPLLARKLDASGGLLDRLWATLQAAEPDLDSAGRTYGGGLVKIEPRELEAIALPGRFAPALSDGPPN